VQIQDDLRAERFGDQRAEDEQVRHIVDMDERVAPSQRTKSEKKERAEDECGILEEIGRGSAAAPLERQPQDVDSVECLSRGFVCGCLETDELDVHAFVDERFGRAPWPWVGG
jgi:hypothetical protein